MFDLVRRRNRERSLPSEGTLIDHTLLIVGSLWTARTVEVQKWCISCKSGMLSSAAELKPTLMVSSELWPNSMRDITYRNTWWRWRCMRGGILAGEFMMDAFFARGLAFITLAMPWQKLVQKFETKTQIEIQLTKKKCRFLLNIQKIGDYHWSGWSG